MILKIIDMVYSLKVKMKIMQTSMSKETQLRILLAIMWILFIWQIIQIVRLKNDVASLQNFIVFMYG